MKDYTGKRFGRLVAVRPISMGAGQCRKWVCICDCGNETIVNGGDLRSGKTQSCRCLQKELITKRMETHGMSNTRVFRIFCGVLDRCMRRSHGSFRHYGGRGIKCRWKDFEEFVADMGESYMRHVVLYGEKDTQIDRIDVNGDYSKENCRWVTIGEQSVNKRNTIVVEINGKEETLRDLSKRTGISYQTLHSRVKQGSIAEYEYGR